MWPVLFLKLSDKSHSVVLILRYMVLTNVLTRLITDITISDQPQELARPTTRAGGARYIQSAAADDEDDLTDDESVTELQGPQARVPTQGTTPQQSNKIFREIHANLSKIKIKIKMRTAEVSKLEIITNLFV